jgi:soluble lytic murein transglycosylase-like protein
MGDRNRVMRLALAAWLAGASLPSLAAPPFDACFDRHAERFGLEPDLLRSIAVVESGMRPQVDNNSYMARTGTRDIGLMQINTSWLPVLARYGVGLAELRDPCTNIEVGAWILSDLLRSRGNSWEALGAYNAACTQLKGADCHRARRTYAWRVWRARNKHEARPPAQPLRLTAEPMAAHALHAGHAGRAVAGRATGLVAASSIGAVLPGLEPNATP